MDSDNSSALRVLMVTPEWPDAAHPAAVPFLVEQVKFLRQAGVAVDVFHFRARRSPRNYLKARFELRRQFDLRSYDLIHAQFGQSGLVVFPAPCPVVITYHGSDLHGIVNQSGRYTWSSRLLRPISQAAALCATETIVVSRHLRSFLPSWVDSNLLPMGVDLQAFRPMSRTVCREKLGLPQGKALVMFAGRRDAPEKRRNLALQALQSLPAPCDAELLEVIGHPHDSMPYFINASNLVILPSLHEGAPTIVKEALACNIPVVSAPVGDVPDRLAGLPGCVIVSDQTAEGFATGIVKSLASPPSEELRKSVLRYGEPAGTQSLLDIYRHACGERSSHSTRSLASAVKVPVDTR